MERVRIFHLRSLLVSSKVHFLIWQSMVKSLQRKRRLGFYWIRSIVLHWQLVYRWSELKKIWPLILRLLLTSSPLLLMLMRGAYMTLDVFLLRPALTTPGLMEIGITKVVDAIRMIGDLITKITKEEELDREAVVVAVAEVMEVLEEVAVAVAVVAVEAVEHQEEVLLIPSILTGSTLKLKLTLSQMLIGQLSGLLGMLVGQLLLLSHARWLLYKFNPNRGPTFRFQLRSQFKCHLLSRYHPQFQCKSYHLLLPHKLNPSKHQLKELEV